MPRAKEEKQKNPCTVGFSYGRSTEPHEIGQRGIVQCYRCNSIMGCSKCCERAEELICLKCHNWATRAGLARHGNVVVSGKVPRVRTDRGWIFYKRDDGDSVEQKLQEIVSKL